VDLKVFGSCGRCQNVFGIFKIDTGFYKNNEYRMLISGIIICQKK